MPEVETIVRSLSPHVSGCVFERSALLRQSALHPLSLPLASLAGLCVSGLWRRGKLLVFDLFPARQDAGSAPDVMIVHLRMTGRIFTQSANAELGRHTRCAWSMRRPDGSPFQLYFDDARTFGKILVSGRERLLEWKFWRELGPEPLELSAEGFLPRLDSRRAIKACLLDQSVIAGIGNIYADEALFAAGINPSRPAASLSAAEASRLLSSIKNIISLAIESKGSSIRDYRDADGNAGAFQNNFYAYGRAGKECRKCGALLEKARIGGRTTAWCPNCQS